MLALLMIFGYVQQEKRHGKSLIIFLKQKINLFGDYEDAVDQRDNFLFHSSLSPLMNLGLITPGSS